jgi:hypothetical protein
MVISPRRWFGLRCVSHQPEDGGVGHVQSFLRPKRPFLFLQEVTHFLLVLSLPQPAYGQPIEEVYDGVLDGDVLGSGVSGVVRLVTHKATQIKYAVKILEMGLIETMEGLKQLRNEIFIMCQLDHPNIVRIEEVYESTNTIYIVQELCLGGDLFDRLDVQPDYHYTEAQCARLVEQMLSAIRYL